MTAERVAHPWQTARLLRAFAFVAFALALVAQHSWSQSVVAPRESSVKAAFLLKFASFVEWPAGTFARPGQPLVIGVADDDEFQASLELLVAGRSIEDRPVVVRRITESNGATVIAGVHILYLGPRRDSRLRETIESVRGPVLIVSSQPQGLKAGSVINFSPDGGRVRFSVSLDAAERRDLKLSARLLAVAQAIEGPTR